ncbi:hypothetical protein PT088_08060, partial [Erysipelothrix rhusiopathiae]|nr:hypothetical protein [Erysipelothrix rhusiopathiae]
MKNTIDNISFLHPESNKEITFTTDKRFIIIYGKNGSGKTTLSRSDNFDENLVFNSDFVNKNIFITGEDGIKMSPYNRKNFSEIWIGEDIVSIVNERELLEKALKENETELDKITEVIVNELNLNDIPKIMDGINLDEDDFKFVTEDISENSNSFKTQHRLLTKIQDEEELKKEVLILKNNLILDQFTSTISNNPLLDELINKNMDQNVILNLNKKIDIMKSNSKEILFIDDILKSQNIDEKIEKHIKDWYDYHKDKDYCIFCGNKDIKKSLQKWKQVFENELKEIKIDLIKELTNIGNSLNPIVQNKQFQEISSETSEFISKVKTI